MNETTRGIRALYIASVSLCIFVSLAGAKAGQGKNGEIRMAIVDPQRVFQEYDLTRTASDQLGKDQDALKIKIRTLVENSLLAQNDQNRLAELTLKDKAGNGVMLTPAEKTEMKAIETRSQATKDDYTRISQIPVGQLLEKDKKALDDYTRADNDTRTRAETLQTTTMADLEKRKQDALIKVDKNIKDTIAKVAKDKGFNIIFSYPAVYFCESDITDDVLKKLNKG